MAEAWLPPSPLPTSCGTVQHVKASLRPGARWPLVPRSVASNPRDHRWNHDTRCTPALVSLPMGPLRSRKSTVARGCALGGARYDRRGTREGPSLRKPAVGNPSRSACHDPPRQRACAGPHSTTSRRRETEARPRPRLAATPVNRIRVCLDSSQPALAALDLFRRRGHRCRHLATGGSQCSGWSPAFFRRAQL